MRLHRKLRSNNDKLSTLLRAFGLSLSLYFLFTVDTPISFNQGRGMFKYSFFKDTFGVHVEDGSYDRKIITRETSLKIIAIHI